MIAFKKDINLVIVDGFDAATDNITDESVQTFKAGEPIDADITDDDGMGFVTLQFGGGGGIALTVQRASFDILA